ncbi:MAG: exodeoxyribonuclease VII small subunit [Paludibacteraceae bacterium]|nr:exodeoxyribonuclease VII small subunit [Paludibacteraceae bacterium]
MTYDEAIKRAEAIIAGLESAEALSMEEYKKAAVEATALLKHCKAEIDNYARTTDMSHAQSL